MKTIRILAIVITMVVVAAVAFVWSGVYDVAADAPHWSSTQRLLEILREQSIRVRSADLRSPDVADANQLRVGAGNYDAMCVSCHLKPGLPLSELSAGLYPAPPNLSRPRQSAPARDFWIVKHGIKMTGMPAWGRSVDDAHVWGLVAFLRELPALTPERYAAMVAASGGHSHDGMPAPAALDDGHRNHPH